MGWGSGMPLPVDVLAAFWASYGSLLMLVAVLLISRMLARTYSQLILGLAGGCAAIYALSQQETFLYAAVVLTLIGFGVKLFRL